MLLLAVVQSYAVCVFVCFSGSPKGIEFNSVKEVLLSVKAVKSMHSLHLWALTLGQALVSVHLAVGNVIHTTTKLEKRHKTLKQQTSTQFVKTHID